jgi:hypothetical protein
MLVVMVAILSLTSGSREGCWVVDPQAILPPEAGLEEVEAKP